MVKNKKGKVARKKLFSILIILLLVGGVLLSATAGFFDFLWGKGNMASSTGDDEYILSLKKQAGFLEESLRGNSVDLEKQAALGNIYYELAMYYWGQGSEEKEVYAAKSKELLLQVVEGGLREPLVTLRIALLAAFIQNDEPLAEKYFRNTLELQEDYPEAHFYYGIFLLSQEREEEAQEHWEKVLQKAEEDSPLAAEVQRYLQVYDERDDSK